MHSVRYKVFGTCTMRTSSVGMLRRQNIMVSRVSLSVANHMGKKALVTKVVVRLLRYVALRSIFLISASVTKSARPMPVALPCEASERSSTLT